MLAALLFGGAAGLRAPRGARRAAGGEDHGSRHGDAERDARGHGDPVAIGDADADRHQQVPARRTVATGLQVPWGIAFLPERRRAGVRAHDGADPADSGRRREAASG